MAKNEKRIARWYHIGVQNGAELVDSKEPMSMNKKNEPIAEYFALIDVCTGI